LLQERYEDLYAEKEELLARFEDDNEDANALMLRINAISEALDDGDSVTDDPLIDKWEADLAAGRMPDLSEGLDV